LPFRAGDREDAPEFVDRKRPAFDGSTAFDALDSLGRVLPEVAFPPRGAEDHLDDCQYGIRRGGRHGSNLRVTKSQDLALVDLVQAAICCCAQEAEELSDDLIVATEGCARGFVLACGEPSSREIAHAQKRNVLAVLVAEEFGESLTHTLRIAFALCDALELFGDGLCALAVNLARAAPMLAALRIAKGGRPKFGRRAFDEGCHGNAA
jgi:hypothetical protein